MTNTAPVLSNGWSNANELQLANGRHGIMDAVRLSDGTYISVDSSNLTHFQADGTLDPAFGQGGEVNLFATRAQGAIAALAVTADGKYLVAGHEGGFTLTQDNTYLPRAYWGRDTTLFVSRYNADGSLDTSFGENGKATINPGGVDSVQAMRIQSDGAIVLAGTSVVIDMAGENSVGSERHVVLARFDSNGKPDSGFGKDGVVISPNKLSIAADMQLLQDGTIVVAGKSWNGRGGTGLLANEPWANAPALLRFHADGSVDRQFGTDGTLLIEYPAHLKPVDGPTMSRLIYPTLAVAPDGKFVLALDAEAPGLSDYTAKYFAVARFNPDGTVDKGFGANGWATPQLALPPEVAGGEEFGPAMSRVRAAIDDAGRITLAAEFDSLMTNVLITVPRIVAQRLLADGHSDTAFGDSGQVTLELNNYSFGLGDIVLERDGAFTVAGSVSPWVNSLNVTGSGHLLAKFLADGTPDVSWQPLKTANHIDYVQGRPDALLNSNMTVFDREAMTAGKGHSSYQGASLVLQREGGANPDDVFLAAGALRFDHGRVLVHGVDIGVVHNSGGVLRLDFSAAASGTLVNDALTAIAYENLAAKSATDISLVWTFSDGVLASTAVTTVTLQPNPTPYWVDNLLERTGGRTAEQMAAYERSLLGPDNTVTYTFNTDPDHGTHTATQRAFIEAEMRKIAAVANVHYVPAVSDVSDRSDGLEIYNFIREGQGAITGLGEGNLAGQGRLPNAGGTKLWMPFRDAWFGNEALNEQTWSRVVKHELGHTLGLKHPFEAGPGGVLPAEEDNVGATLMAYDPEPGTADEHPNLGRLDIAALQYLYGPSQTARTGNDTYVLTTAAFDPAKPDVHNFIWDGKGTDTISGATLTQDITLYLEPGRWGYIGQRGHLITDPGQITVNYGTVIENATGGRGNDTITGNSADNVLRGGVGNDTLTGLQGNDRLDGGAGFDMAVYSGARSEYTVQRGIYEVRVSGPEGADVLTSVERVAFADGMLALDTGGKAGAAYRLYRAALGGEPDVAGLGYWIHMMDHGMSMADAARSITESKEFASLYGGSHDAYLKALYQHVLQRAPDATGLAWWTGQMDHYGVSDADVLLGFSNSAEFQALVVGSLAGGIAYQAYTG